MGREIPLQQNRSTRSLSLGAPIAREAAHTLSSTSDVGKRMPQTGIFNLASIEGALSAQSPTNLTVGLTILKLVGHRSIDIEITVGDCALH